MPKEKFKSIQFFFWFFDFLFGVFASLSAIVLHFYVLAPNKQKSVLYEANAWYLFSSFFPEKLNFLVVYFHLGVLFSLCQIFIFQRVDLYQIHYRTSSLLKELLAISRGVLLNLFVMLSLIFFYRETSFSRSVIIFLPPFMILYIFLGHRLLWVFIDAFTKNIERLRRVVIVGTGKVAQDLNNVFQQYKFLGYHVVGNVEAKPKKENTSTSLYKGDFSFFLRSVKKLKPSLVFYADRYDQKKIEAILRFCDSEGIQCCIVPNITNIVSTHSRIESVGGIPLLFVRGTPLHNGYNQFVKRIFDIVIAFAVLLLLSPVFLVLSIVVRMETKGGVFFRQERMGLDRKSFWIWKFQTMTVQDRVRSDTIWGIHRNDSRITKFGSFLRKTSLDELPQFWNVLRGDMSIVGPRPERPFFVKKFQAKYDQYMRRHMVKSGITGWAQIQGLRGDTSIQNRIEADIYYIENWSFGLDLLILLKTPSALIRNPGS